MSDFEAAVVATAVAWVVDAVDAVAVVASSVVATVATVVDEVAVGAVVAAVATVVAVSVSPLSAAALAAMLTPRTAKPARLDAPTSRRARRAGCGRRRRAAGAGGGADCPISMCRSCAANLGGRSALAQECAGVAAASRAARTVGAMGLDPKNDWTDPAISAYIAGHTAAPDELQRALITETAERTGNRAGMQVSADQGALLALFVGLVGARNVVEVGTFTGYSSLCMARALPIGGRLLCCDVSEEWTAIARRYWVDAGVADRITLRIAPALLTLRALPPDVPIDMAFIDADKTGYAAYYTELLARLRPSGLILVDNTLWSGRVLEAGDADDDDTVALRAFNDMVAADARVESYILPVADGLTVIRKR